MAGLAQPGERIGGVGRDAQRGVRLLVGRRCDGGVLHRIVVALVGELLAFPCLQNDLQRFGEPFLAFVIGDAEYIVGTGKSAAADAELEAALANVIDSGHFLGYAKWVAQGQHVHGHAHPQPLGAGCYRCRHDDGRREHRPGRVEVQFGQPDAVQTHLFRRVDHSEALLKCLGFGDASSIAKFHECAKVHVVLQ